MTASEFDFYCVLVEAIPSSLMVFAKVRLADVVQVSQGLSRSEAMSSFSRINQKHVDFLLVRTGDMGIIAVIELDDRTHAMRQRLKADEQKDFALQSAGVPIVRIPVGRVYDVAHVRSVLAAATPGGDFWKGSGNLLGGQKVS